MYIIRVQSSHEVDQLYLFLADKLPLQSGQPTPPLLLLSPEVGTEQVLSGDGGPEVGSAVLGVSSPSSHPSPAGGLGAVGAHHSLPVPDTLILLSSLLSPTSHWCLFSVPHDSQSSHDGGECLTVLLVVVLGAECYLKWSIFVYSPVGDVGGPD